MFLAESEGLIESLPMITWGNDQNTRIRSYLGELLFIITCLHEIKGVFDERIFPLIQLLLVFSYRLLYSTTLVFLHLTITFIWDTSFAQKLLKLKAQ